MQAESASQRWTPSSEGEKSAIRDQLDRLLLDPYFRNSKRYPSFLRYVVSQALEGESDSLKERVLGVEVFGRSPDYDSTQDPIVRVTAAEIRKRISKYYLDPAHQAEIRVLLPAGSYVPLFEFPENVEDISLSPLQEEQLPAFPAALPALGQRSNIAETVLALPKAIALKHHARLLWTLAGAAALFLLIAGGFWLWRPHQHTAVDTFWAPVTESLKPTLFCIADQSGYASNAVPVSAGPAPDTKLNSDPTLVAAEDTVPLVDFVSLLRPRLRSFRVQVQGQTNFSDLGAGPTILIGAFDNKWTLFVTNPLRFHFASDPGLKHIWIEDREQPTKRDWSVDADLAGTGPRKDYALISRFVDPDTGQVTVVAAGLGHNGTSAAGTFLLSPQSLGELEKLYPRLMKGRNLEVVIETLVVNGHPGPPHIDAVSFW